MIYIFSSKNTAALKRAPALDKKNNWVEILPLKPRQMPAECKKIRHGDQVYIDISGLSPAELKKVVGQLKKGSAFWGIIDPKGAAEDPASFFFNGAFDYISPALIKSGLTKKRFAAALSWAMEGDDPDSGIEAASSPERENINTSLKLPAGKFEGWKSIRSGTSASFFYLYLSVSGRSNSNLRPLIGENAYNIVKGRLRDVLQQVLWEADALLWIETEGSSLFLIPPRTANIRLAVEAILKMLLNSRLIGIEKLGLSIPVDFTFALHYGQTIYHAPGKTGAIVSEPVNFIFHLGTKRAETGRLTISDNVPEEAIPEGLQNLFARAGSFEGIPIRHSRRFVYE